MRIEVRQDAANPQRWVATVDSLPDVEAGGVTPEAAVASLSRIMEALARDGTPESVLPPPVPPSILPYAVPPRPTQVETSTPDGAQWLFRVIFYIIWVLLVTATLACLMLLGR